MKSKIWMVGLLTVATFGFASLPAKAQGDSATVQETSQDVIITGERNHARQDSNQVNVDSSRRRGTDQGTVQRVNQNSDIQGRGNDTHQNADQYNRSNGRSTRR